MECKNRIAALLEANWEVEETWNTAQTTQKHGQIIRLLSAGSSVIAQDSYNNLVDCREDGEIVKLNRACESVLMVFECRGVGYILSKVLNDPELRMFRLDPDSPDTRRRVLTHEYIGDLNDLLYVDRKYGFLLTRDGDTRVRILNFLSETIEFELEVAPDSLITHNSEFIISASATPNGTMLSLFHKQERSHKAVLLPQFEGLQDIQTVEDLILLAPKNAGLHLLDTTNNSLKPVQTSELTQVFVTGSWILGITSDRTLCDVLNRQRIDLTVKSPAPDFLPVESRNMLIIADEKRLIILNMDQMTVKQVVELSCNPTSLWYNEETEEICVGAKRGVVQKLVI